MTLYDVVAHDRASVDENVGRVTQGMNPSVGERKYRRKDGSLLDMEVSAGVIFRDGRETMCAVAHDVTERRRAQELLEARVATLSRISAELTLDLPGESTLDALAESAVEASTAVACGVLLLDGEADRADLFGSHGLPDGYTAGLQEGLPVWGALPEPGGLPRPPARARPRHAHAPSWPTRSTPPYTGSCGTRPWDVVYSLPLVARGRALGAIFFCFPPDEEPGEDERIFLRGHRRPGRRRGRERGPPRRGPRARPPSRSASGSPASCTTPSPRRSTG